jgi:hypothetical protein
LQEKGLSGLDLSVQYDSSISDFCFPVHSGFAHAQDALTGRVYEDKTTNAMPGVTIRNIKNGAVAVADRTGGFSISAKVGDLVVFSALSYVPDTLYVKDLRYTEIKLIPKGRMLNQVNVTGAEVKTGGFKDTRPLGPLGGQTVVYQTDAVGNYTGGLAVNIFDSHSAEKKRQKGAQLAADDKTRTEIDNAFSPENIQKYLPIDGQELQNFIVLYRPTPETYRSPAFNMALYINQCYKEFLKTPADKRKSKDLTEIFRDSIANKAPKQQ